MIKQHCDSKTAVSKFWVPILYVACILTQCSSELATLADLQVEYCGDLDCFSSEEGLSSYAAGKKSIHIVPLILVDISS